MEDLRRGYKIHTSRGRAPLLIDALLDGTNLLPKKITFWKTEDGNCLCMALHYWAMYFALARQDIGSLKPLSSMHLFGCHRCKLELIRPGSRSMFGGFTCSFIAMAKFDFWDTFGIVCAINRAPSYQIIPIKCKLVLYLATRTWFSIARNKNKLCTWITFI